MSRNRIQQSSGGRVYLLWAEGTQMFKIGFTDKSVNNRARALEFCSPIRLRIVGNIAGSRQKEIEMHHVLQRFRSHGEWFQLPGDILWGVVAWFGLSTPVPN